MKQKITRENYTKWVAEMEHELERTRFDPALSGHERYLTAGIGTMHWEFGHFEEAQKWYHQAITLARGTNARNPLTSIAFLYWMAGYPTCMKEECNAVREEREQRLPELQDQVGASEQNRRDATVAYLDLAVASFLLKDYEAAERWAKNAHRLQLRLATLDTLSKLARSLRSRDESAFGQALIALRKLVGNWPSFEIDTNIGLYRVAQLRGRQVFGSIPDALTSEDLYPEKWAELVSKNDL